LKQARQQLNEYTQAERFAPTREDVIAYSTLLRVFCDHYPSQACAEDKKLLQLSNSIFVLEEDRFYKQRRIALSKIVEQFKSP